MYSGLGDGIQAMVVFAIIGAITALVLFFIGVPALIWWLASNYDIIEQVKQ